ncbi:MAG: hypothetical protein ABH864_03190 [archaeon]
MKKNYVSLAVFALVIILLVAFFLMGSKDEVETGSGNGEDASEELGFLDISDAINQIEDCREYEKANVALDEIESTDIPREFWDCALVPGAHELPSEEDVARLQLINGSKIVSNDLTETSCNEIWTMDYIFHVYAANFPDHLHFSVLECNGKYFYKYSDEYGPRPQDVRGLDVQIQISEELVEALRSE